MPGLCLSIIKNETGLPFIHYYKAKESGENMLSSSLEDYLEIICRMKSEKGEVKTLEIAQELKVPLSRVVQAIQRLHYQKFLVYSPYKPLEITQKGQDMGTYLTARNKLIKEFLEFLEIEENLDSELVAMQQYLSVSSLETIEKFILFTRQYPEVSQRYKLFSKKVPTRVLLPELPE